MYLNKNIRYLRKKMGLSQIAFSDLIGAKRNSISDYERGRSNPSIELIQKVAILFKVSLDELIEQDLSIYSTKTAIPLSTSSNQLNEAATQYQTKVKYTPPEEDSIEVILENQTKTQLIFEIQELRRQNKAKDKEIFYLQNLLEAKNQSIHNLKKLIEYLESASK